MPVSVVSVRSVRRGHYRGGFGAWGAANRADSLLRVQRRSSGYQSLLRRLPHPFRLEWSYEGVAAPQAGPVSGQNPHCQSHRWGRLLSPTPAAHGILLWETVVRGISML